MTSASVGSRPNSRKRSPIHRISTSFRERPRRRSASRSARSGSGRRAIRARRPGGAPRKSSSTAGGAARRGRSIPLRPAGPLRVGQQEQALRHPVVERFERVRCGPRGPRARCGKRPEDAAFHPPHPKESAVAHDVRRLARPRGDRAWTRGDQGARDRRRRRPDGGRTGDAGETRGTFSGGSPDQAGECGSLFGGRRTRHVDEVHRIRRSSGHPGNFAPECFQRLAETEARQCRGAGETIDRHRGREGRRRPSSSPSAFTPAPAPEGGPARVEYAGRRR